MLNMSAVHLLNLDSFFCVKIIEWNAQLHSIEESHYMATSTMSASKLPDDVLQS